MTFFFSIFTRDPPNKNNSFFLFYQYFDLFLALNNVLLVLAFVVRWNAAAHRPKTTSSVGGINENFVLF